MFDFAAYTVFKNEWSTKKRKDDLFRASLPLIF